MSEVRYRILGPLSVTVDGEPAGVTAGRDRVVLAMLLLNAGRIVGLSEITEAVWGADPPATAKGQLQTCVSRLRRALPPDAILTDRAGYGIQIGPDELDAVVFGRLVDDARTAGSAESARSAYKIGLDLWRGPACAEIDAQAVRQAAAALDERRALAIEDWVDLELDAGRAREIVGELGELVQRFPLRERLRGQFMIALHRSGRQADALAEFRRARDTLAGELGIEPGPELQDLHRRMLVGEPPPVPSAPIRCLPRTVGDFTGRDELVDRLLGGNAPVLVIDGMAGSGKTTLALHLAALAGDRFPDAHLFVDLHGHSEQEPLQPAAALSILLRQLGVGADAIPAEFVERVALWRTETASRRLLVVLDNAASSAQLADLVPTSPGSLTLVTSRRRLAGLDDVQSVAMPLLDPAEATALLGRIAGDRIAAEPEAAAEVVRRCGGLPLAVRLAGARLAHRPRWRVADLLNRLNEAALPELTVEHRNVGDAFALSYTHLAEPARRQFLLLGLYPGRVFDAPVAAALSGLALPEARDLLDDLVDVHLLEEPEPGTYRMHDLLREFAAALAGGLPVRERQDALAGVLDLQLHVALATNSPTHRPVAVAELGDPVPLRPDLVEALADPERRMDRDIADLTAFTDAAVAAGRPDYGWKIPRAAWCLLYYRSYQDTERLFLAGLAAARIATDPVGEAALANCLASVYHRQAEYEKACEQLMLVLQIRERLDDLDGVGRVLGNLANVHDAMGRFAEAVELGLKGRRAMALSGVRVGPSSSLNALTVSLGKLGRYREGLYYARLRLLGAIENRDRQQEGDSLTEVIRMRRHLGLGDPALLRRYLTVAIRLTEGYGCQAKAYNDLAEIHADDGRFDEALALHRRALDTARRIGDRVFESEFLYSLGRTQFAAGRAGDAYETFEELFRLSREFRLPYAAAQAEAGLAACVADTDPDRAHRLWTRALTVFTDRGTPARFEVAERLAELRVRIVR
ncbi:BTAD domain-containing putative transcriptional regulator [Actinoplanes sp. NPDC051861]|uniref:AfsR/SARP family transcriptional regulator n=1 Tax=Actinoplanes sp. NPDC051861 TaxID=3155170 RepID=UPI00343C2301